MIRLTEKQAGTLFEIVKFANQNGGRVPTGPEFARIIGIGSRGALDRINRILDKADFVRQDGKIRYINYHLLITEEESARFCLLVYNISKESVHGRVTISEISNSLGIGTEECIEFAKKCCDAAYLIAIPSSINVFRAGPKIFDQLNYLELMARK